MVPEDFGKHEAQHRPYRRAALKAISERPLVLLADSVCLKCHTDVGEERAESLHKANGAAHGIVYAKASRASPLVVEILCCITILHTCTK